jgi:hypothetical protein
MVFARLPALVGPWVLLAAEAAEASEAAEAGVLVFLFLIVHAAPWFVQG